MRLERRLDPRAVEQAEALRQRHDVLQAAEKATEALGELTPGAVDHFATSREQVAVLACLARIQVDSLKTLATRARTPARMLTHLETAAKTLEVVHRNPVIASALHGVRQDHEGRAHDFLTEMQRDEAKTIFAAKPLYDNAQANALSLVGERLLNTTYEALPEHHPTKPLIGIELQLVRAARGEQVDREKLLADFNRMKEYDKERNPHRFATVAAWLSVWGERLSDPEIREVGAVAFNKMAREHPEWKYMAANTRQGLSFQHWQETTFGLLAPVTTSADRRSALFTSLVSGGNNA